MALSSLKSQFGVPGRVSNLLAHLIALAFGEILNLCEPETQYAFVTPYNGSDPEMIFA